ncbi:hypothetical protein BT96DRAFT_940523 [Gymnopus androsaceus JB14]|uniref:Uncharacterized protein n=1 Tax=Gymnopus androsaceus JB14 TaxID=1447944 RepID=A0A6A4HKL0_9AGAR|nr:hypothetical protein BT96DRAFT_940523 [Gymnopus androsaceus JB14]
MYLLISNGAKSLARKILLFCMVVLILTNSWNYVVLSAQYLVAVKVGFMQQLSGGVEEQALVANNAASPWDAQNNWTITLGLMFGDGIVTWRACAVWPGMRSIRYVLVGLMAANIAVNLADCIVGNLVSLNEITETTPALNDASTFLSLAVNMIATLTVAVKVWYGSSHVTLLAVILLMIDTNGSSFAVGTPVDDTTRVIDAFLNAIAETFHYSSGNSHAGGTISNAEF